MGGSTKRRKNSQKQVSIVDNDENEVCTASSSVSVTGEGPKKISLRYGGCIHEEHKMVQNNGHLKTKIDIYLFLFVVLMFFLF